MISVSEETWCRQRQEDGEESESMSSFEENSPVLLVTPEIALIDAPVTIRLHGLPPGQNVSLRAWLDDTQGNKWASWARFRADAHRTIDVGTQRPEEGTYQDADPMGVVRNPRGGNAAVQGSSCCVARWLSGLSQ